MLLCETKHTLRRQLISDCRGDSYINQSADRIADRDAKLDKVVAYVPELAAVWRSVEIPSDPAELEAALGRAGIAAQPRSTERKRVTLPKVYNHIQSVPSWTLPGSRSNLKRAFLPAACHGLEVALSALKLVCRSGMYTARQEARREWVGTAALLCSFVSMCCATWLQERKRRKQRAIDVGRATNFHMPELFQGEAPRNIDEH